MTIVAWNPNFDVGVDEMNEEHQVLIDLMNRLHDMYEADADRDEQGKTLEELAVFTVRHFTNEEKYMESIHYDKTDPHKRIHADLLANLGDFKEQFDRGQPLTSKFFSFLKLWLSAHIQGIDKKYGPGA